MPQAPEENSVKAAVGRAHGGDLGDVALPGGSSGIGTGLGSRLVRAPLPLLLGSSDKVQVATPRLGPPAASARMGEQFYGDEFIKDLGVGCDVAVAGVQRQEVTNGNLL